MEEDGEILEPLELPYSDLVLLSSSSSSFSMVSSEELERLESISRTVMETLGPLGPGLLAITGVPRTSDLRATLLPFARNLTLLSNEDRRRVLKDHSLGSDVPLKNLDRSVSSFAMQLKYVQHSSLELTVTGSRQNDEGNHIAEEEHPNADRLHNLQDYEFKKLGDTFKELGFCMMELGLRLAKVCDKAIGGRELEQSILDSLSAKGRLIHYHSTLDNLLLKGARKITKVSTNRLDPRTHRWAEPDKSTPQISGKSFGDGQTPVEDSSIGSNKSGVRFCKISLSNLWQQWHYDYGIFTVLTSPMFISPCHLLMENRKDGFCMSSERECLPPDAHSYLQIFDPNKNKILVVRSPPESFIVQVGESADILSKGKLCSTLHSVCKPLERENLSRESFVVFLQPAWDKTFSIREDPLTTAVSPDAIDSDTSDRESHELSIKIHKMVPPLSRRLKDGMTFAEFSRETTKQYYGGSGMQSKR